MKSIHWLFEKKCFLFCRTSSEIQRFDFYSFYCEIKVPWKLLAIMNEFCLFLLHGLAGFFVLSLSVISGSNNNYVKKCFIFLELYYRSTGELWSIYHDIFSLRIL